MELCSRVLLQVQSQMNLQVHKENLMQVEDGPHNESGEKDKSEDDSCPKEVNTARQHVNTASPEVNTGRFKLNIFDPSVNTASSYELDSPKDMFKLGASHTLETTHVEFFSDEDELEVDLGNITNSYTVPTTPNTRIHKDYPIKNVIGDWKQCRKNYCNSSSNRFGNLWIYLMGRGPSTGQMHTPQRIKFPWRTSFKGRRSGIPSGDKERKTALSISKLKASRYLDFGLEELVPSLWVESECDYDISAAYGITHWWFRRKQFYINKHSEPSDREAVRSQMRILSVIRVKTFEKYGYSYLREIILRRAAYKEYEISEKDFKNLHPNDFEDLYLLNIQDKLNHLSKSDKIHLHTAVNTWIKNLVIRNRVGDLQLRIESYQTKLNLERPNWDATDYSFKEDYTIVPKTRAVIYKDINDQRKLMRLNEIHKFSDGTLTRVMEKLDHMVKDFHLFEYNKGMETRKWSEDDKRRSKDFITAIQKRLQIRRIFRSLKSFVGGRIRDIDYRLIN
ncbi:hypothetical protein Tco_1578635 [Tanacetum coccineum]